MVMPFLKVSRRLDGLLGNHIVGPAEDRELGAKGCDLVMLPHSHHDSNKTQFIQLFFKHVHNPSCGSPFTLQTVGAAKVAITLGAVLISMSNINALVNSLSFNVKYEWGV